MHFGEMPSNWCSKCCERKKSYWLDSIDGLGGGEGYYCRECWEKEMRRRKRLNKKVDLSIYRMYPVLTFPEDREIKKKRARKTNKKRRINKKRRVSRKIK